MSDGEFKSVEECVTFILQEAIEEEEEPEEVYTPKEKTITAMGFTNVNVNKTCRATYGLEMPHA